MSLDSEPERPTPDLDVILDQEDVVENKVEKIGRIIGTILVVPTMFLMLGLLVGILCRRSRHS